MALYRYEAMNRQGSVITGTITAADEPSAISHLSETGLTILDLEKQKENKRAKGKNNKKVKVADLSLFSRQLAAMLGAGIPVTQSINTLSKQTENGRLAAALEDISELVKGGANLTEAFAQHPRVFPPLYRAMIGAGEVGGILETALIRLSIQLQKEKQLNDNIKSASSYPKMIGGFAIVMFFGMLVGLVPVFEGFIPKEATVPKLTEIIFALSRNVRSYYYIWVLVVVLFIFGSIQFWKGPVGHRIWENYKMRLPLFGAIIQKSVIARFSRTLATLLQGGIPVVQALKSAGPTSGSDLIAEAVEDAVDKIESGKNIAQPLENSGLFPPMVINMIAIGEEAGTLTELLDKIAEFYEEDVATATKSLGSVLEPIMLIAIGILVGGMLISLYLPIFTAVVS